MSVWNRIPNTVRDDVVALALEHEDLTPRELAIRYTDEKRYFVSKPSVYRVLKAEDLIMAPAHAVIRAAEEFRNKTTRPNELWQADFTYLKVIGWCWFYLSTILDDYSRYIIAWKLCTSIKPADVTDTLELALQASSCDQRPRSCTNPGCSVIAARPSLLPIWPSISRAKEWITCAMRHIIPRPKERFSVGIRR